MAPITALRCDLEYAVHGESHFFFNLEAAHSGDQRIVEESLVVTPDIRLRTFEAPGSGNRFFRCDAQGGKLQVRYDARIERIREPVDTTLQEAPVSELPHEVLHYLMPGRYCQSDVMSRAAQHLFGQVPQGYQRVQHICEWLRSNIAYQLGVSNSTPRIRPSPRCSARCR